MATAGGLRWAIDVWRQPAQQTGRLATAATIPQALCDNPRFTLGSLRQPTLHFGRSATTCGSPGHSATACGSLWAFCDENRLETGIFRRRMPKIDQKLSHITQGVRESVAGRPKCEPTCRRSPKVRSNLSQIAQGEEARETGAFVRAPHPLPQASVEPECPRGVHGGVLRTVRPRSGRR